MVIASLLIPTLAQASPRQRRGHGRGQGRGGHLRAPECHRLSDHPDGGRAALRGRRRARPSSALAGLARPGGPAFTLRDYGHCGLGGPQLGTAVRLRAWRARRTAARTAGSTRWAASRARPGRPTPSGIRGNGRLLRSGQRVLWFWCQASAGGCQRTLERLAPSSVARGGDADGAGHAAMTTKAAVRRSPGRSCGSGPTSPPTAPPGGPRLIVPVSAGRYPLSAVRGGLVPAFPETIVVR